MSFATTGKNDALIVSSATVVEQFLEAARSRLSSASTSGAFQVYSDQVSGYDALVLPPSILVIGSRQSIQRVAAVIEGKTARFVARTELAEMDELLTSEAPVRMAAAWPVEVRDASNMVVGGSARLLEATGLGALAAVVDKFGIGRAMGMSCGRNGAGLRCELVGVMQDESTASLVSGGLSVLKGLASLMPSPGEQRGGMSIEDLTVSRRGTTVVVGLSLR
jgi:hypothetical protein